MPEDGISRRNFLKASSLAVAGVATQRCWMPGAWAASSPQLVPLAEFGYGDVALAEGLQESQFRETIAVLMGMSDDSLLKPFRQMAGQAAPGEDLGGWYHYDPKFDWHKEDAGFAPGCTFGQWVSALARAYAATGLPHIRAKVVRLNRLYAQTISGEFYDKNRFPAYSYDKLVCGLLDSHRWAGDPDAWSIMDRTTATAVPYLPKHAVDRELEWRPGKDQSYRWDESYTNPENLFLAYQQGAGARYRELAVRFLDDKTFFDPLAEGHNVLGGKHAYSYVNALSSAMQAYMVLGSGKHLRAARNAFAMLEQQSFVTGGWGPDEMLRAPGSEELYASLTNSHNSFETPCGGYAHSKITRYLLRVTRDARYGDSMERMLYNTVLGAKPLNADGRAFYYSDYNFKGKRVYSNHRWPCCSGTLPQLAADYRINTYFRDAQGIYVNSFIRSTVRWRHGGAQISLTQKNDYPNESALQFEVGASVPTRFAINLRIPQWAEEAELRVNGKREVADLQPGSFHSMRREWRTGDRIELELPLRLRLEPFDKEHADTVALMRGPLVLFPLTNARLKVRRKQLLAAMRAGSDRWRFATAEGVVDAAPFTAIGDSSYTTYVEISGRG
ncbi:MAG: beta-L-arabinofuranosidase domain-containing protein [Acidobacteriaceae bacterium]